MSDAVPPPPPGPKKRPGFLRRPVEMWVLIAGILLGIGVGGATESASKNTSTAAAPTAPVTTPNLVIPTTTSPPVAETPSPPAPPPTVKKGTYGLASCDIGSLFSGGGNSSIMVGSTSIKNTGTAKFAAKVEFAWLLADGSKLSAKPKTVRVGVGGSISVLFHAVASQDQVSLFQAMPTYSGGGNQLKNGNLCRTKVTIK